MALTLHTIQPKRGSRTKSFRVGRGLGSGRGKTAGRGTKGQRSRSGGKNKLKLRGMKQMLLSFPKNRGFHSHFEKATTVPLTRLSAFPDGAVITLGVLKTKSLVSRGASIVKIVGTGKLDKKWTLKGVLVSAGAKAAIEAAGGTCVASHS